MLEEKFGEHPLVKCFSMFQKSTEIKWGDKLVVMQSKAKSLALYESCPTNVKT